MKKDPQHKDELVKSEENLPTIAPGGSLDLISDEDLLGMYDEIMSNLREDRDQTSELLDEFAEMVINGGDASNASKEALVNLVRHKLDTADKMTKIAELKTRIKLKQPYGESKGYLNKGQNTGGGGTNTINIYDQGGLNKRSLLDTIEKAQKKGEK
jgi:hypothetical protein